MSAPATVRPRFPQSAAPDTLCLVHGDSGESPHSPHTKPARRPCLPTHVPGCRAAGTSPCCPAGKACRHHYGNTGNSGIRHTGSAHTTYLSTSCGPCPWRMPSRRPTTTGCPPSGCPNRAKAAWAKAPPCRPASLQEATTCLHTIKSCNVSYHIRSKNLYNIIFRSQKARSQEARSKEETCTDKHARRTKSSLPSVGTPACQPSYASSLALKRYHEK